MVSIHPALKEVRRDAVTTLFDGGETSIQFDVELKSSTSGVYKTRMYYHVETKKGQENVHKIKEFFNSGILSK